MGKFQIVYWPKLSLWCLESLCKYSVKWLALWSFCSSSARMHSDFYNCYRVIGCHAYFLIFVILKIGLTVSSRLPSWESKARPAAQAQFEEPQKRPNLSKKKKRLKKPQPLQKKLSNLDLICAWHFCLSHSFNVWTIVKICNTHCLDVTF